MEYMRTMTKQFVVMSRLLFNDYTLLIYLFITNWYNPIELLTLYITFQFATAIIKNSNNI